MRKTKEPFLKPIVLCINEKRAQEFKRKIEDDIRCDIITYGLEGRYDINKTLEGFAGVVFIDDSNTLIEKLLKEYLGYRQNIHTITLNNDRIKYRR